MVSSLLSLFGIAGSGVSQLRVTRTLNQPREGHVNRHLGFLPTLMCLHWEVGLPAQVDGRGTLPPDNSLTGTS